MRSKICSRLGIGFIGLTIFCAFCRAETPSSTLSVNPGTMPFGHHDIGTATPEQLTITNDGNAPVDLWISISGEEPGDFSASGCLNRLMPKHSCQITVEFNPAAIGKDNGQGEDRKATLTVSNDTGERTDVLLSGRAFQNLGVFPAVLAFEGRIGSTSTATRTEQLTNYTNSNVNGLAVTAIGDFTENHSDCSAPLAPGGSCGILVTYSPKQAGDATGSLIIAAN